MGPLSSDDYFFEHVLTQQAAYHALLQQNRKAIHGLVADVLAQQLPSGIGEDWMLLPEVARHEIAAGRYAQAHSTLCRLLTMAATMGSHSSWQEWEKQAEDTWRELHRTSPELPASHALELARAEAVYKRYEYDKAQPAYERAFTLALGAGDLSNQALCLSRLGFIHAHQGKVEEARELLDRAVRINEETGMRQELAGSLISLGFFTMRYLHDAAEAERLYMRALEIARGLGSLVIEAMLMNNLGILYHENQGRMQDALACFEFALNANRSYGNITGEAIAADNLGGLLYALGRCAEAQPVMELSVQRYADAKDIPGVGSASSKLGLIMLRDGDLKGARPHLQRALDILEVLDESYWLAFTYLHWGDYALAAGDPAEATEWFKKGFILADAEREPLLISECHLGLARAALALCDWTEVQRQLEAAHRTNERQQHIMGTFAENLIKAELELIRAEAETGGSLATARQSLNEAAAILHQQRIEPSGPDGRRLAMLRQRLEALENLEA